MRVSAFLSSVPKSQAYTHSTDLPEPHILRSLSNVKAVSIHTSCVGCHCVVLDIDGVAWIFGRNDKSCLGVSGVDAISENEPRRVTAQELGAPKDTRFVQAACGRNHTLLVGSDGQLWTAGANHAGQVSACSPSKPAIPAHIPTSLRRSAAIPLARKSRRSDW